MRLLITNEKNHFINSSLGLDKTDLSGSVKDLHLLLQSALARLYPQWPKEGLGEKEDLLEKYVARHSVQDGVPQHQ
jgi:hypothetical protein